MNFAAPRTPSSNFRGFATIGSGFFTLTTTARLELNDNELTLFVLIFKKWFFPKASIISLAPKSNWFSDGFVIAHTISNYIQPIAFFTMWADSLTSELKRRGYPVS